MNYNLLLAYLTELGSGDWAKFRQAIEFLAGDNEDLYPSALARQLGMLGHVEFAFSDEIRWSVCPPVLAWLPRRDVQVAALCGGRSQQLVDIICEQASKLDVQVKVVQQDEGPDAIFIAAQSRAMADELAASADLVNEPNLAVRMARYLPSLGSYVQLCSESPEPSGYTVRAYDTDSLKWVEVPEAVGEGLYWYEYYRPEYRLKMEGRCLKTMREIGIYVLLRNRHRSVLRYDSSRRELSVPVRAPLPDLFARAATLSSGFLPSFQKPSGLPTHVYREVPASIARAIAAKLCQTMEA
jgi:hypothetical protein